MRHIDNPSSANIMPSDCIVATPTQRAALSIGPEDAGKVIVEKSTGRMYLATMTEGAKSLSANLAAELAALYLLTSGEWSKAPSIFRLRLTGTGSVVIDSRDKLGAIASNIATYVLSSATNQIEFPYLGDVASDIRATFGPGITVEIL